MPPTIALVGDPSPAIVAHRAIPRALELANRPSRRIEWAWVPTREIHDPARDLTQFAAVWLVPGSPYEDMAGALEAVRFVRETRRPFLGTCGGFQHALIEIARNVAGLSAADHAESNPSATAPVVTALACSLVGKTGSVRFAPDSLIRAAYQRDTTTEEYHCNYGLNAAYQATLEKAGLRFTAFDDEGQIRAAELRRSLHPFFVGTLFQPERAALREEPAPLVAAFVEATIASAAT